MKKIAIMTWFRYNNYGSVLQAYALGKYLRNCGYEVSYIDYLPNKKFPKPLLERLNKDEVFAKFRRILNDGTRTLNEDLQKRGILFSNFINENFEVTQKCDTNSELELLCEDFDTIICGSDQIWSPLIFDEKFFLTFAINKKIRKIAYASSFGMPEIKDKEVFNLMRKAIEHLDYISVREDSGLKIVQKMTDKKAEVVVDPIFLLREEEWNCIAKPYHKRLKKPYILLYLLGDNPFYEKYISWGKKNGYEMVIIPFNNHDYKRGCVVADNVTPEQFVYLIKESAGVCTDSFHGTAFSILFKKPFVTLARFKDNSNISQNERLYTLLNLTKQEQRFAKSFSKKKACLLFESPAIMPELEIRITKAYEFLKESVEERDDKKEDHWGKKPTITCSGCGVCVGICPTKSIKIVKNQYGFYEVVIDKQTCVGCMLCKNICGFNSHTATLTGASVYAARSKAKKILMSSSSGGFATSASVQYLKKGYQIIGCMYDYDIQEAIHTIINSEKEVYVLSGSKYIQSHMDTVLEKIDYSKKYLAIGTPCQIASFNNFLLQKGIRNNFILIDLICHGVPSYNLWHKYIELIRKGKLSGEKICSIFFRKKFSVFTNNNMNMQICSNTKSYRGRQKKDLFFKFFCLGNVYAKACYNCNFRLNSAADVRIGDYWGKKYERISGTSMILTLTDRGTLFLDTLRDELEIEQGAIEDYMQYQQVSNLNPPDNYEKIMKALNDNKINVVYNDFVKKYYLLDPVKDIVKAIFGR